MAVGESEYKLAQTIAGFLGRHIGDLILSPSAVPAPGAPFGRPPQAAGAGFSWSIPPHPRIQW